MDEILPRFSTLVTSANENASIPNVVRFGKSMTNERAEHLTKAPWPMAVNPLGKAIELREVQS